MSVLVLSVPRATENTVDDDLIEVFRHHQCPFRDHVRAALVGPLIPAEWDYLAERLLGRAPAECGTEETEDSE